MDELNGNGRSEKSALGALGPALEALAKNPQMLASIMSLMGNMGDSGKGSGFKIPEGLFDNLPESPEDAVEEQDTADREPADASSGSARSDADIFSAISPELIAKLPEIISAAKPVMEAIGNYRADTHSEAKIVKRGSISTDKRNALLLALKPYVNEHRQHTVDMIVSVSKFSSVLQKSDK